MARRRLAPRSLFYGDVRTAGRGQETLLDFPQADILEDLYADLKTRWVEWYWGNLAAYFGSGS